VPYEVEFLSGYVGGWLYAPVSDEPRPGIVILHGSDGGRAGWSQWQELLFAMQGYCTLAPSYSSGGNAWHSGDIHDVDLDNTEAALIWLRKNQRTTGMIGLYGASRGGEHALLATSLMVDEQSEGLPDAVAAHSPSDTIVGAFIAAGFDPHNNEIWDPSKRAWRWRGSSDDLLPSTPIEIEKYDGPLFLSHGERDIVWTVECTRRLESRLIGTGHKPEVYYYADAGHGFDPETQNVQNGRLVNFFHRNLRTDVL